MLRDLEQGVRCLGGLPSKASASEEDAMTRPELLVTWDTRLNMTQSSFRTQEPLLCLQRIMLGLSDG